MAPVDFGPFSWNGTSPYTSAIEEKKLRKEKKYSKCPVFPAYKEVDKNKPNTTRKGISSEQE